MVEEEQVRDIRDVVRLGHPVLRQEAEMVPERLFGSAELRDLAETMIRTMMARKGVGLAAPQVGESRRLFVYWVPGDDGEVIVEPTVLVNPDVREVGPALEEGWEGCLSIPGLRGRVPRFRRVKVKARDVEGAQVSLTADQFHARVIQHENDHLNGIVFLDRMESLDSLAFEEEWQQFNAAKDHSEAEESTP